MLVTVCDEGWRVMAYPLTKVRMSAADYFQLPETNVPTQLLDGDLLEMTSPLSDHQDIVGEIFFLFKFIQKTHGGGKPYVAPMDVWLDDFNVPQPDVFWVMDGGKCVLRDKRLYGAPDLIVEVLSSGTMRVDKREKFHLYEKHGVREYWLVHPTEAYIEVWIWTSAKYQLLDTFSPEDTFTSPVLEYKIDLKLIFTTSI